MPDPTRIHHAKAVKKNPIGALDGFQALNELVGAARECILTHQVEKTKQVKLRAYEQAEVSRIKAAENILRSYFEQVFAERRSNFDALFTRLDQALDQGNGEAISAVVRGIVDIARTSPLADLGDLSQIRAALDDPDHVWDL